MNTMTTEEWFVSELEELLKLVKSLQTNPAKPSMKHAAELVRDTAINYLALND